MCLANQVVGRNDKNSGLGVLIDRNLVTQRLVVVVGALEGVGVEQGHVREWTVVVSCGCGHGLSLMVEWEWI